MTSTLVANNLRLSVDIALPVEALTDRGQTLRTPLIVSRGEPCSIRSLSGRELELARQLYGMTTHQVTLRFNSRVAITPKHYLVFRGRKLNIGYIDNVGQRDDELRLLCAEEVT